MFKFFSNKSALSLYIYAPESTVTTRHKVVTSYTFAKWTDETTA